MTTQEFAKLLDEALANRKKSRIREVDLLGMLRRSLGIDRILCTTARAAAQEEAEFRRRVHAAFGAPGDWGYDTPLGKALQNLYVVRD